MDLKGCNEEFSLWLRFSPWPENFHVPGVQPKKGKKEKAAMIFLDSSISNFVFTQFGLEHNIP